MCVCGVAWEHCESRRSTREFLMSFDYCSQELRLCIRKWYLVRSTMTWIDDGILLWKCAYAPADATRALFEREDDKIEEQRCLLLIIMAHSMIDNKSWRASSILLSLVTVFIGRRRRLMFYVKQSIYESECLYFWRQPNMRVTKMLRCYCPVTRGVSGVP